VLLLFGDVALWEVEVPELQEDAKLVWVSEGEGEYFDCTHGCGGDGRNEEDLVMKERGQEKRKKEGLEN
jgi:hypothetical protein